MADKLIMGYWDCAFCGEKKIPGTQRACPCCGKVRGADAVFYMDEAKQELTEEQAKTKGKGADWYCSFCDSLNSVLDENCKSCGASRAESERNYFELQEKKRQAAEKKAEAQRETEVRRENPSVTPKKRSPLLFLIPLLIIGAIIYAMLPKTADLEITDVYWHNIINIEQNTQVQESDWSLPSEGELQKKQQEIHHYDQVFDHYEEETYYVTVQSGSHTEYSYKDNGDGTFTEVAHEVPDYTEEARTRDVAVYRDEPVYATKYYYLIWRWLQERTVETEGHDKNPVWGDTKLKSDEREGGRYSEYTVTGKKKDKEKVYTVSEEIWNKLKVGDNIECTVRGSEIIELK